MCIILCVFTVSRGKGAEDSAAALADVVVVGVLLDGSDDSRDAAAVCDGVLHGVVVDRDVHHRSAGVLGHLVVAAVHPQRRHYGLDSLLVFVESFKTVSCVNTCAYKYKKNKFKQ